MRKVFFVFITALLFTSCGKDNLNTPEVDFNREEVIEGLRISLNHFREVKMHTSQRNDQLNIEDKYRDNLMFINSKTGLSLDFNKNELDAMVKISPEQFLTHGPDLSEETSLENIEKMKANGSYEVFLEVQEILEEVYSNQESPAAKGMTWGCAGALAANFLSTLSLGSCVTVAACPVAVASKALSMVLLADACL